MSEGIGTLFIIMRFGGLLKEVPSDDDKKELFLTFIRDHPDFSEDSTKKVFTVLIERMSSRVVSFEILMNHPWSDLNRYQVLTDMIWRHLIADDTVSWDELNRIMRSFKQNDPRGYTKVMELLRCGRDKLINMHYV